MRKMFNIPNATIKNFLVQYIFYKEFKKKVVKYIYGWVLDIGCGEKPYINLLSPYIEKHIGVDLFDIENPLKKYDFIGTAYDIPINNQSFDSVICTAVLEHVEEPAQAINECYRILRSKGYAIYSIPFIWHVHEEPRDFYRFSKYGANYLFEKAGFEIIENCALSGFWVTFGQLFVYNLYRYNRSILKWFHLIDFIALIIQFFSYVLDKIDKSEQWTWMNLVVVKKP